MTIRRAFRNMPKNPAELDRLFRNVDLPVGEVDLTSLQTITTDRLLGRDTAGTGAVEQLTVSGGVEFSGSGGIRRSALTGDVTASAGSNATTIANDAVTFAKMQNIATDRLIGRDTAASGDPEEISVSGGLEFTGSAGIQRSALTGDVTASAGSNSTTIPNNTVTYAKIQDVSATDRILGRSSAGAGDIEEITCTSAGRALLDDANAAAQRTTLGLGTAATQNTGTSGTNVPLLDGGNTWSAVQTFSLPPILPTYTVATVPSAATYARGLIYVSDESGGAIPAFSDGTNWRRVTDRAIVS